MKKFSVKVGILLVGISTVFGAVIAYISTAPNALVCDARVSNGTVQLTIKNSGITTAYKTTLLDPCIYVGDYPPKVGAMLIRPNTPTDLAPGQEFLYEHRIPAPSKRDLQQKRKAIYAHGVISCEDWLGVKRTEPFSLIYGGPYSVNTPNMGIWNPMK